MPACPNVRKENGEVKMDDSVLGECPKIRETLIPILFIDRKEAERGNKVVYCFINYRGKLRSNGPNLNPILTIICH